MYSFYSPYQAFFSFFLNQIWNIFFTNSLCLKIKKSPARQHRGFIIIFRRLFFMKSFDWFGFAKRLTESTGRQILPRKIFFAPHCGGNAREGAFFKPILSAGNFWRRRLNATIILGNPSAGPFGIVAALDMPTRVLHKLQEEAYIVYRKQDARQRFVCRKQVSDIAF